MKTWRVSGGGGSWRNAAVVVAAMGSSGGGGYRRQHGAMFQLTLFHASSLQPETVSQPLTAVSLTAPASRIGGGKGGR